jgi:hypothetical protein
MYFCGFCGHFGVSSVFTIFAVFVEHDASYGLTVALAGSCESAIPSSATLDSIRLAFRIFCYYLNNCVQSNECCVDGQPHGFGVAYNIALAMVKPAL